jgi:hypothetical protein
MKDQGFMGKTNFTLSALPFNLWAILSTWLHVSSKNTRKMSLIPVFNQNSPRAHTELKFDVLGAHRNLVKYVVHSSKRKN